MPSLAAIETQAKCESLETCIVSHALKFGQVSDATWYPVRLDWILVRGRTSNGYRREGRVCAMDSVFIQDKSRKAGEELAEAVRQLYKAQEQSIEA